MAEFERIAAIADIEPGGRTSILVDDTPALLIRVGDTFYVIEDVCTHDGQPLTDGPLDGTEITCPRHGARFDIASGRPICMPATEPIRTFEVEVRGSDVCVRLAD